MKILHIIDSLGVGGAEKLLVNTINSMPSAEHHILTLTNDLTLKQELMVGHHIQVLPFNGKKSIPKVVKIIRAYIKQHQIDIVHSHLTLANLVTRLATLKPSNVKIFNTVHTLSGTRFFSNKWSFATLAEKWSYKPHHTLIAVSNTVKSDYASKIPLKGPTHVLYNFVDDRFFATGPKTQFTKGALKLVAVGSLKEAKNFTFLVQAMQGLAANVTLDIYGEGPLRPELETTIKSTGAAAQLMGNKPNVYELLKNYDVLVMPSKYEGHPVALMEAMASGLPVLVSDIPVFREATEGHSIYFKPNSISSFQEKIQAILSGAINLEEYAAHNLKLAGEMAKKETYLQHLLEIYNQ